MAERKRVGRPRRPRFDRSVEHWVALQPVRIGSYRDDDGVLHPKIVDIGERLPTSTLRRGLLRQWWIRGYIAAEGSDYAKYMVEGALGRRKRLQERKDAERAVSEAHDEVLEESEDAGAGSETPGQAPTGEETEADSAGSDGPSASAPADPPVGAGQPEAG